MQKLILIAMTAILLVQGPRPKKRPRDPQDTKGSGVPKITALVTSDTRTVYTRVLSKS